MGLKMAAVVDNNVRVTEFGDHLRKECKVILTTDPDVDLAVFELLAARITSVRRIGTRFQWVM
jgi:hypothetical protein